MDIKIYTFLPYLLTFTYARGPHHPRGEKVVRRHVHYKPTKELTDKITEDVQLLHDKEHIQEHLEEVVSEPDFSKMTDEEIEFYYFQVHDSDNNSKLDGLELLNAIFHIADHDNQDKNDIEDSERLATDEDEFQYYVELIDRVLSEDDMDHDGYLSYSEYVAGRRKYKDGGGTTEGPVIQMLP